MSLLQPLVECLACHESASASGGMFVHVEGIVLVLACCSSRVPEWDLTDVLKQDDTRCCCLTLYLSYVLWG